MWVKEVFICSKPTLDHQKVKEYICKLMSHMISVCEIYLLEVKWHKVHVTVWLRKLAVNAFFFFFALTYNYEVIDDCTI